MNTIPNWQRLLGFLVDGCVLLAFACVLIGAGHGVGPIGLLMIGGSIEAWGWPMAVGWVAVTLLALGALVSHREFYFPMIAMGLIALVVSWGLFISQSA